ncbi:hypothetical protein AMAG_07558 [Allomyces macrogynus ATCC 38327]|uniref:Zn(2)-C6 fungal-type domain-containing protein n=1 Tax=Allomyces macrogynus (strain ATCC 38327) TaxID=578462 RepID=A0A0L0SIN0_ALLM3|nr:hypothetical protein AMAG_07558 [Allomyces macrogynus ATCC 38327]|eukprot:KNE62327.1 hypothetical protein AMAG_07558 [Allomyces macrogynus ATCC 38327]
MDQHVAFNDRAAAGTSAGNATTVPMRRAAPPSPEATPTVPAPTTRASRRAGGAKRRKVPHACAFCRRSRMSCDEARPCQRCIKRQIAHLCYDEPRSATVAAEAAHAAALAAAKAAASAGSSSSSASTGTASASPSLAADHHQHDHHHHVHGPGCAHDHTHDHAHAHDAASTVPHAFSHPHPSELHRAVVTSHAHMLPPPHHGHAMPAAIDYHHLNASMSSPMMMNESGLPTPTYAPPLLTLPPASSPVVSDTSSSQDLLAYLASPTSTSSMATPPLGLAPQGMGHALFAAFGSAAPMNIFGGERTSAPSPSPPALDLSSLLLSSAPSTPTPSLPPVTSGSGTSMLGFASDFSGINQFSMFSTLFDALEPTVTTSTTLPEPVLAAPPVTVASQSLTTTQSSAVAPMMALTTMPTMPQQPMTPTTATAPMSSQVFASPVSIQSSVRQGPSPTPSTPTVESAPVIKTSSSSTQDSTVDEAFLLSVADPTADSTAARLQQVIQAKFAAGLLRPHNYAQGYARLAAYAEAHFSPSAKQRIVTATKSFRPTFRAIASTMTPLDHVLAEEMFDRLLLDYDRLFAAMAVPACLWRRTGEIYKANQPFADLVGIPLEKLKNGKVTIYELMAEEAAVNYWEKFAGVAGDPGQKAVLTSCVLIKQMVRSRPASPVLAAVNLNLAAPTGAAAAMAMARALRSGPTSPILRPRSPTGKSGNGSVSCCFSFTVRRDKNQVPIAIVGNFLPTQGARL